MEEAKIKHLEMVQGVISRLSSNSFVVKGWSVTVVAALIAVAADQGNFGIALLALFPAFMFWGLDALYLHLERRYRVLHNEIVEGKTKLFSMTITERTFANWFRTLWASTIAPIHLTIIVVAILVALALR